MVIPTEGTMEKVVKLAMVAAALVAGFDAFAAPDKNPDAKVEKVIKMALKML